MLERIEHINSGYQFKGNGNSAGFEKAFQNAAGINPHVNDSIRFSPAAHFLSKVNWQLKEMSSPSKGTLIIVFLSSGFEFNTEIEFSAFFNEARHSYNILKSVITENKKTKVLVRLSSKKKRLVITESFINRKHPELKGLSMLFDKIIEAKETSDVLNLNSPENKLFTGIEYMLEDEFEYINLALYNLVSKLTGIKLPAEIEFPEDQSSPIIIEKVTAVDDRQIIQ